MPSSGGLQRTSSPRVVTICFPSGMCCIITACLARNVNSSCLFASSLRNCCQLPGKLVLASILRLIVHGFFWFQTSGCPQSTGPTLYPPRLCAVAVFNIWQEDFCCIVIKCLASSGLQHIDKHSTIKDDCIRFRGISDILNTASEAIKKI